MEYLFPENSGSYRDFSSLKEFLDRAVAKFNTPSFIESDPLRIPHMYSRKEDIEIAAFFSALFSWGRRSVIVQKSQEFLELMDYDPYEFILNFTGKDLLRFSRFKHRTFLYDDTIFFLEVLQNVYRKEGGLCGLFQRYFQSCGDILESISLVRNYFYGFPHLKRSEKHFADPMAGSAAKRINMFLRWMVRKDNNNVDFGLWRVIPPQALYIPLDIHSGRVARKLGLLKRKVNDRKAVEELTRVLRIFDPLDPVKYDFALFGLGWYGNL